MTYAPKKFLGLTKKAWIYQVKIIENGKGQLQRFFGWWPELIILLIWLEQKNIQLPGYVLLLLVIGVFVLYYSIGTFYINKDIKKLEGEYENDNNFLSLEIRNFHKDVMPKVNKILILMEKKT